jgi:SAM-dependent methyltransferase
MKPAMDTETEVAKHYTHGSLEQAILAGLTAGGKDIDKIVASDLSGADEFHLGWRAVTIELAKDLDLAPGLHVLDVGSGIGGPARYFAEAHGARVTGIDLTQEFVDVANALTRRCGLGHLVSFTQGSALALPFADATFDAATLIHVGMNIADKARLFAEVRRCLKPGARFCAYDIMLMDDGEIPYPMPWAATPETSFVETPGTYRRLLATAGFEIETEHNRRDLALRLGREMRENTAKYGAPPLGLHILMGPATAQRLANVMTTLERGTIAPVEMIARTV